MPTSYVLLSCTAVAAAICVGFELRTLGLLSEDERRRFRRETAWSRPLGALLGFVPIFTLQYVSSMASRAVLLLIALGGVGWVAYREHQRLRALDFDPSFLAKLSRAVPLALLCISLAAAAILSL